jgi:hypothetical protein
MSYIGNVPTTAAFLTDTFSGNGSTTAFTMSIAPATTSSVLVSITGVLQSPDTYSVSGTTLTFSAAPPSGTNNISARYLGIPASGVTTTAYRTVTNTTATAGQTSFTIPSYTVGYVDVYRNGVYLPTSDYTATTGTTVVLNNGATVGDTITTISFYVSSVLNAIPNTAGSVSSSNIVSGVTLTSPIITGSTPQVTTYLSSSGTYTVPTNCRYLYIKMVGGGGGGGGGNSGGAGGNGGTTTFGSSLLTCAGGTGGASQANATGGLGGGATLNSPATGIGFAGSAGSAGAGYSGSATTGLYLSGGQGGGTPFAQGAAGTGAASTGITAVANSGAGGGGSSSANNIGGTNTGGGGGGAGAYIEAYITSPSATYSYAIGAGGTAGAAGSGTGAGGAGAAGVIYITAFF